MTITTPIHVPLQVVYVATVELGQPLQDYINVTWEDGLVRVLRLPERSGLIRARHFGAKHATGDVLFFVDAHCEAAKGW